MKLLCLRAKCTYLQHQSYYSRLVPPYSCLCYRSGERGRNSSLLEVQEFDTKRKDTSKKYSEHHRHGHNRAQHIVMEAKGLCNKVFYRHWCASTGRSHQCINITELGDYETIECPCYRARPIVPTPPLWDFLQEKDHECN